MPHANEVLQRDTLITMSVYNSDVPIFQVEVTGEKMGAEDDEKKLMLTSCWNLCYTSKTFGMEVAKSCHIHPDGEKARYRNHCLLLMDCQAQWCQ